MERVRVLLEDALQYVQNASPRERRLLLFAGAGALAFVLLVVWAAFGSSIRRHQGSLDEKRSDFEKVQRLSAGYAQQEQERQMLEARLRQSPPALMGFVDDVEFYCDGTAIQVRSASRLGYSDLGVNRKRVEVIREAFDRA